MGKSMGARGVKLYSHQVKEDYFRMDRLLGDYREGDTLQLVDEPPGILLRTMLLGESSQEKITRSLTRGDTGGIPYLTLFYSRFLELAPWFQTPPGPRPLPISRLTADFLFKFGVLLDMRRDQALRVELEQRLRELDADRVVPFIQSPEGEPSLFLGFQIIALKPFSCRVIHYFDACEPTVYYKKTSALAYFQPLEAFTGPPSENLQVEAFFRAHTSSAFAPDLKRLPDAPQTTGSGKKVVFKQRGLPVIHGRAICYSIQSAE